MTFEQLQEVMSSLQSHRKFVHLRIAFGYPENSERLYHEVSLTEHELKLIKMIKDFGPSTYVALLATSEKVKERSQLDEIVNGRVTSALFKSDCDPLLWDKNIELLEAQVRDLKKKQKKISKLEKQIAQI